MSNKPFTRMCVCCRERHMQHEMIRVVKLKNGEFVVGKADSGRSVYVCSSCKEEAIKKRALNRAFKCDVSQEIYEQIKNI